MFETLKPGFGVANTNSAVVPGLGHFYPWSGWKSDGALLVIRTSGIVRLMSRI